MEKEIWKPVKGYEGLYEVSNLGRVRSLPRTEVCGSLIRKRCGRELKPYVRNGYMRVTLSKYGAHTRIYVHRLVAIAFIPNPKSLPFINHKDENPSNNSAENLEWCDGFYNMNYGTCKIRQALHNPRRKPVFQYSLDGVFIAEYSSSRQAGLALGVCQAGISACCNGKAKTAHGYKWYHKKQE